MLSVILFAALAQATPPPAARPAPLPTNEAIALFQRLCADTLPSPGAFARALEGFKS